MNVAYGCIILSLLQKSKEDFEEILKESININPKEFKLKWYEIIISRIISIFSPLM